MINMSILLLKSMEQLNYLLKQKQPVLFFEIGISNKLNAMQLKEIFPGFS